MRPRSLAVLTVLALASAPFLAGAASSADTVVGETFVPAGVACQGNQTLMQTASVAPSYAAASAGVITSWRTTGQTNASTTRALKVGRVSGATITITATSALVSVPAGQTVSLPARVPVQPGDVLGVYTATVQGTDTFCYKPAMTAGDAYAVLDGNAGPGSAPVQTGFNGLRVPVAATVEPDADGDGFGDTTQDSCPTQAGTQGACKDLVAPNTSITSAKAGKAKPKITKSGKKKFKKAEVTVTFTSTEAGTFGCSIDGAASTPCRSPLTVKLKKGTHTIAVRATDAAGNVDATPATTTVTVKKAKTKKKR